MNIEKYHIFADIFDKYLTFLHLSKYEQTPMANLKGLASKS